MKAYLCFAIFFASFILACTLTVNAQKGIGNLNGIGQQIEKPPIISLSGELVEMRTAPCEHSTGHAYIGTHLFIKSKIDENLLNIHLGAAYAVDSFVENLKPGQQIYVQVFRTEQMEKNHFIAKEVTADGIKLQLRDDNLRPFWAAERVQPRLRRAEFRRRGGFEPSE